MLVLHINELRKLRNLGNLFRHVSPKGLRVLPNWKKCIIKLNATFTLQTEIIHHKAKGITRQNKDRSLFFVTKRSRRIQRSTLEVIKKLSSKAQIKNF